MAALPTRFCLILIYLQINIIADIAALTLPLQTITTKCETIITKQNLKEIENEKLEPETISPSPSISPTADITYTPFAPISVSSFVSPLSNNNKNGQNVASQESFLRLAQLLSKDVLPLMKEEICIKLLPLDEDLKIGHSTAVENEPKNIGECYSEQAITVNPFSCPPNGIKLPIATSSTVTCTTTPSKSASDFNERRNFRDIQYNTVNTESDKGPASTGTLPLSCVSNPLSGLSVLAQSSITNPETLNHQTPINSDLQLPFEATSFSIPQMFPNIKSIPDTQEFCPCNNVPLSPLSTLLSSGITIPLSVTSSPSSPDSPLILNTVLHYGDSTNPSDLSNNCNKPASEANLNPSQDLDPTFSNACSSKSSSILRELLNTLMPQAMLLNNEGSTLANLEPQIATMPVTKNLPSDYCDIETSSNMPKITSNTCDYSKLSPAISPLNPPQELSAALPSLIDSHLPNLSLPELNYIPSLPPLISSPYGFESPLSFSCTMNSVPTSNNKQCFPISPANINICNDATSPIISEIPQLDTPQVLTPTLYANALLDPVPYAVNINNEFTPLTVNKPNQFISDLPVPFSLSPSEISANSDTGCYNNISSPFIQTSYQSDYATIPSYSNPCLPTTSSPEQPQAFAMPSIPTMSFSPIGQYFERVKASSARLNEFIKSFNERISSPDAFKPLCITNTVSTPTSIFSPNISPLGQVSPVVQNTDTPQIFNNNEEFFTSQPPFDGSVMIAPIVPKTFVTACNYPVCSTPEYNVFQNSLSSLSYNDLFSHTYNCFTSSTPSNPYADLMWSSYDNLSFLPPTFGYLPSSPIERPKKPITKSANPTVTTNLDNSLSIHIPDVLSTVLPKSETKASSQAKKPYPFISSISINTASTSDDSSPDSSFKMPSSSRPIDSLSPYSYSSTKSSEDTLVNLNCDEIEKLITLLESSISSNGDKCCDLSSLFVNYF